MNWLLAVGLLLLSGIGVIIFLLFRLLLSIYRGALEFVTPTAENSPSGLAKLVQDIGITMGRSLAVEVKTTLMGKASGDVRLQQALKGDVLEAAQPGLAGLLDTLPIRRNHKTSLMELLVPIVQGMMTNKTGPSASKSDDASPKFNL